MNINFEPIYNNESKILILGSFPSVKSRDVNFYYGNPQNRFWKMLEYVFGEKIENSIDYKKNFLLRHKIALWDILKTLEIKGSSDSDINSKNSSPVDLSKILKEAKIEKILCNGQKSFELFNLYYKDIEIKAECLPSTSPANTRFDMNKWKDALTLKPTL